jgi:hypothetical protein
MSPMSGSPKRVARSADPPMANARKPVLAIRRADNASCASGVTSGRSSSKTLAIDGRSKMPPNQYWNYTTRHRRIFRGATRRGIFTTQNCARAPMSAIRHTAWTVGGILGAVQKRRALTEGRFTTSRKHRGVRLSPRSVRFPERWQVRARNLLFAQPVAFIAAVPPGFCWTVPRACCAAAHVLGQQPRSLH